MTSDINQSGLLPIQKTNRIEFLDVLRGIAILFIFTANILSFAGFWAFPESSRLPWATLATDDTLDFVMFTLVDGKFYSIFSLLFGIGCAMQINSLQAHGKPFAPFFKRRMFWLLLIGLIHLCLFWLGDILTLYALLGFALIGFVNCSNKKLITFAIILILFPIANWLFVYVTDLNYASFFFKWNTSYYEHFGLATREWNGRKFADFQIFISNESLSDFFKYNLGNTLIRIGAILNEGRIFKVMGIFLIGLWAGRKIIHDDLLNNVKLLKKIAFWGLIIGLPISTFRSYVEFFGSREPLWDFLNTVTYALGTVPLAMGIAASLALLYRKKSTWLHVFAQLERRHFLIIYFKP